MSEDEHSMTPAEIKNIAIDEIIAGLGCGGIDVTREEIIRAVADEKLREKLRNQIELAHQASDEVEQHSPGKNFSNLVVMHTLKLISFDD